MAFMRKNKAKPTPTPLTLVARMAVSFLAVLALSACGKTLEWKQEVPLQDGRVIVVDRISKQGPHDPLLNMRMEIGQELAFNHPETGERIRWAIPQGLQPYMLDFDGGVPYYVLSAYTVADYNKWGCPNPPYLVYRYEHGQWRRISLDQFPAKFQKPNLMDMAKSYEQYIVNGYVTSARLEAYFESHDAPYRVIGREKVNPISEGCGADVLFAQGRESEMDEKSRRRYVEIVGMTEESRRYHPIHMEKLRKELKEKQK